MKRIQLMSVVLLMTMLVVACAPATPEPATPTPTFESPVATPETVTATPTSEPPTATLEPTLIPTATPEVPEDPRPEAGIMILEPGPASRVTGPVHVAGVADPTHEQTLVVRILLADGTEVAQAPTMIEAPLGERGPFEVDVPLNVTIEGEEPAFIQVFHRSARDGEIVALESVGVTLTEEGPEEIETVMPYRQQVAILSPENTDTVTGGVAEVNAFGWASFEQTLVVDVQDETGEVVGTMPVTLSGELGEPVPFTAEVTYTVESSGPGRVVIRDISPAFGGDSFLTSVEVTLEP